jgi:hypothetical protein
MASAEGLYGVQVLAGYLLILSAALFFPGAMLYTGRAIWKWRAAAAPTYLRLERGFVMAALLAAVLGFTLLDRALEATGSTVFAPMGLVTYIIAAALGFVAETGFLGRENWPAATTVAHVVLAFLAQAAFGAALIETSFLPAWAGWVTVIWNLAWLVVLPIRRRDMYYPWLHYVAPLLIGILLLSRG